MSKEEEILAKMAPLESLDDADFRAKVLLYGDPGSGKTDLGIHIANALGDKVYLVYSDAGWTTIQKYPEIAKKVEKVPFEGFSTINNFLTAREMGIAPYSDFDVLQWDTTSTGVDIALRNLVGVRKFPKDQYAPDLEGRPHYRLVELALKELIDRINKTDLHVVYTAHLRFPSEKDVEQGKLAVRPNFPEASYRALARMCNMVGYLYKNESGGQRFVQLSGTKFETAKCQIPNIPEKTYKIEDIVPLLSDWISKR